MKRRILIAVALIAVTSLLTGCSHLRTYHGPLAHEQAESQEPASS